MKSVGCCSAFANDRVVPSQTIERRCGLDFVFEIRRRAARRADARPGGVRSSRQQVVKDPGAGPTSSPAPSATRSATRAGGPQRTRSARRAGPDTPAGVDLIGGPAAVGAVRPMAVVERHEIRTGRGELGETRHKPVVLEDRLFPGAEYTLNAPDCLWSPKVERSKDVQGHGGLSTEALQAPSQAPCYRKGDLPHPRAVRPSGARARIWGRRRARRRSAPSTRRVGAALVDGQVLKQASIDAEVVARQRPRCAASRVGRRRPPRHARQLGAAAVVQRGRAAGRRGGQGAGGEHRDGVRGRHRPRRARAQDAH